MYKEELKELSPATVNELNEKLNTLQGQLEAKIAIMKARESDTDQLQREFKAEKDYWAEFVPILKRVQLTVNGHRQ